MPAWPQTGITWTWTIRKRIGIAFISITAIVMTLAGVAVTGVGQAGRMVAQTYDETVVTTLYARAAWSDFASMRAALSHALLSKLDDRRRSFDAVAALDRSFRQDLATATEALKSTEVVTAAEALGGAEQKWFAMSQALVSHFDEAGWALLEEQSRKVEATLETMVGKVAERGFQTRQSSLQRIATGHVAALGATAAGFVICLMVLLALSRGINGPLKKASALANEIAKGKLDGETPRHGRDEIGQLTEAMVSMRSNIRGMMDAQEVLQRQSQARVAEALDGSSEGVVIVQADGVIQLINARARSILGLDGTDVPDGTSVTQLVQKLRKSGEDRSRLLAMGSTNEIEIEEVLLSNGRWIQSSRSHTSEGGMVALYTDITAIRAQRDALAAANLNLDGAMANMSQGLCAFDAAGRLTLANPLFYQILDLHPENAGPGTPHARVLELVAASVQADPEIIARVIRHEQAVVQRSRPMKRTVSLGHRMVAVTQAPMPQGGWLATIEDVTERRKAEARIAFLANHDPLTGLPNRTLFARRAEEALARARRGVGFAIHCIDLDHFKEVNDNFGHAIGDELLREVTERLITCMRDVDTIGRLGGDEFAVLQANVTEEGECALLAERIIARVGAPYHIQGQDVTIGVSIGVARAPANGLDHGKLLRSADSALYKAKEDGRGTWRMFENAMDEDAQARRSLQRDLRQAVANGEFEIYYQPLLETKSMEISGFEALLRWNHPDRGMVPPSLFIPVAEETGMIVDIGRWVLERACAEATTWPGQMRVAVNVSAIQLREKNFKDVVAGVLSQSGLPASRLELEITESAFMTNNTRITPVLTALKEFGVNFAMDDFGTGYSSLSNLRAFPFSKIKIDRSFVRDLGQKDGAEQIARTIVMLGKTLGMRVTAEGVETPKQLQFLDREGCDDVQGYLVGRPMPVRDIAELLGLYNGPAERAA